MTVSTDTHTQTVLYTHTHLLRWLEEHPLISIRGLEKEANTPANCIARAKNGLDPLPRKHYPAIVAVLSAYGYVPAGE